MKAVVITIIITHLVLDVLWASAEVTPTQKEKGIKCKNNIIPNSFQLLLTPSIFYENI